MCLCTTVCMCMHVCGHAHVRASVHACVKDGFLSGCPALQIDARRGAAQESPTYHASWLKSPCRSRAGVSKCAAFRDLRSAKVHPAFQESLTSRRSANSGSGRLDSQTRLIPPEPVVGEDRQAFYSGRDSPPVSPMYHNQNVRPVNLTRTSRQTARTDD